MMLNSLNSHLNTCAISVHYDLGGGNLGYLFLEAPPSTYTLLRTLPFIKPTNVGPKIAMPEPAPTELVFLELFQIHADNLRVWQEYNNVDRAITRVINTIVTEVYFWTLQNCHAGYATVRILDILTHMHATYGVLEDENIQSIDMAIKAPINGKTHFEDFLPRLKTIKKQWPHKTRTPPDKYYPLTTPQSLIWGSILSNARSGVTRTHRKKHGPHSKSIFLGH